GGGACFACPPCGLDGRDRELQRLRWLASLRKMRDRFAINVDLKGFAAVGLVVEFELEDAALVCLRLGDERRPFGRDGVVIEDDERILRRPSGNRDGNLIPPHPVAPNTVTRKA